MMNLNIKDDKEIIVKSTLQPAAVLELGQNLDIQGPKSRPGEIDAYLLSVELFSRSPKVQGQI